MRNLAVIIFSSLVGFASLANQGQDLDRADILKNEIIDLARKYEQLALIDREGDEDLKKQESLEVLVEELIELKPQPEVKDRIGLIVGVWRQIWGPYNYRSEERIVPEDTIVDEIYQAVFSDGYYYNVSPNRLFNRFEYISLLRGEYTISESNPNGLNVEFTGLRFNRVRPDNMPIWALASLAESNNLPQPFNIVPDFIVQNNFQGGTLVEVYTDSDLRILYGTNDTDFNVPFIYIMEKVGEL
jgi:hypothetical protein